MRPIKSAIVLSLLCLFVTFNVNAQSAKFAVFRSMFQRELKEAGIVGGSFLFLQNNKITIQQNYGSANLDKNQPVDENTIYHWASNTKPFTGIAIMQLRDRRLLSLDDKVTKYLPELRGIHNSYGSMDEITIRHLMTHSGGFRNGTWPWRTGKNWEPFEPTKWSQLVAMFPFTEVQFKPGSKFSYSNPAIIYLGRIIETITKDDYEVYIDKNILKPLEMYSSYFDTTPQHLLKHRSHSYYIENGKRTEGKFDANTGITVSNSGLNSPISDMVKYLNFLTGAVSQQAEYDLVLKRSSLEEMWLPQLKAETDANGNRGFTTDIGLIYFIDTRNNRKLIGHGGDQNGFLSYIDVEPATRSASLIVLNTNVSYPSITTPEQNVVSKLRNAIRGLY